MVKYNVTDNQNLFYGLHKVDKVMLPVVFEEFKVIRMFFATLFFSLSQSLGKRSILTKIL